MSDLFNPESVRAWFFLHPHWVVGGIALISFIESFAILGIVVPGIALLGATCFVAGSSNLPVALCLGVAFLGAVSGDALSFFLGRHFHADIKKAWPLRKYPQLIGNGEAFFLRYGAASVAIGRFVGPIRPVIPLVAGMFGMRIRLFLLINVASATLWAPVYVLPAYFLGAAVKTQFAPPVLWTLLIVCVAAIALLFWIRRRYLRALKK